MADWNNVQRQFVLLVLLTTYAGRTFTYADLRAKSGVYDPTVDETEDVAGDLAVLVDLGLVETHHAGRQGYAEARQRTTKQVDFHLTWAEHRALSALREAHPRTGSPSPAPVSGGGAAHKLVGLLRIIREVEEASRALTLDDLVRRTGLSRYMVRSRVHDVRELAYAAESLPDHLHDFILINRDVDWTRPLGLDADVGSDPDADADADADVGTGDDDIVLVVADRPGYWHGIADDRSTLATVGLARVGLFAYSVEETIDRLSLIAEHGPAITDDAEHFHLQEAYWKLRGWLETMSPQQAAAFPAALA